MASKNHVLVTGGAGFIGSHLVERLLADGCRVTVLDDCSTGREDNLQRVRDHALLKFRRGKVSDCSELADMVESCDFIFHLAAAVGVELVVHSPIRTIHTNLKETESILETASRFRVPVLLTSTSEVYGKSQKDAFDEEDDLLIGPPHLGRWSYACSKLMDEFLALAYSREKGLPVTVVRLFNTVGPRQSGNYGMVLPRFISAAQKGEPLRIHGDGKQTRCFCFVADTVEALTRLQHANSARGEVFNVGSTEQISIQELAERVIRITGSSSTLQFVPYDQAYATGFQDMLRRRPITEKLARHTGFRAATPLDEIIRLTSAATVPW
ncbi:MAG: NAD-dependent epimerase/dehydratase family protein [Pedosphaera sp.]|nr:NAD-dependent epimerase/dehydratase family protein [Pedosphaera sp.]